MENIAHLQATANLPERLTVNETARFFNCHFTTVYTWIRRGLLPAVKWPSGIIAYIPRKGIEKYLKEQGVE